jgi:uncharacterized protein YidB (DUF937 family)
LTKPAKNVTLLNRLFDFARERGIMTALDAVVPAGRDKPYDIDQFASAIGASACTKLGFTSGVFTMVEPGEFLKAHKLDIRKL